MNIEYINKIDGSSSVKDENGNIKNNNTKVNDKILILENKINKVKKEKEKIKSEIKESKIEITKAKILLKLRPVLLLGTIACGFAIGGAFTNGLLLSNGVNALLSAFIGSGIITAVTLTRYTSILKQA